LSRIALLLRRASLAGSRPGGGWLRPLVMALALSVALASFLHSAHGHEADGPGVAKICTFCASFERGSAPPPAAALALRVAPHVLPEQPPADAPRPSAAPASFRSRAPPHFQA
jgi:hypothetical protein